MGIEGSELQKLYIRLPIKITDEVAIKELHPNIIQVHIPRQKSRRWCIVDFENKEKLNEALVVLKEHKINNKSIKVKPYLRGSKSNKKGKDLSIQSTESLEKLLKRQK